VQNAQVLDVGLLANTNRLDIAANDRAVPNAGVRADDYIAYDRGARGDKDIGVLGFDQSSPFRNASKY
jgi:hypothetical protein